MDRFIDKDDMCSVLGSCCRHCTPLAVSQMMLGPDDKGNVSKIKVYIPR